MNRKLSEHTSLSIPLATRMRPLNLDDVIGQEHLIGRGKPLRVAVESGHLFSFVLWGPPGVGKTTIARIYAHAVNATLYELSAVSAGKDDVRKVIDAAKLSAQPTILFLDEIHRFNKAQQDFLLPHVETGTLILVGATTENPSFEIIPALLSRCRVFVMHPLTERDMLQIIAHTTFQVDNKTASWLATLTGGDARQLIGLMEQAHSLYGSISIESITQAGQVRVRYDKTGDEHYNTISAFIKSMRASNADAALYYLARMVEAGEDPVFIARRMVIFASEDIGLAQPTALVVANAVFEAVHQIGMPEAAINLAHGTVYLANCKKDRRAYDAFHAALQIVQKTGTLSIPLKLRNAPTKRMKGLGYGDEYVMYSDEDLLPEEIAGKKFFSEN